MSKWRNRRHVRSNDSYVIGRCVLDCVKLSSSEMWDYCVKKIGEGAAGNRRWLLQYDSQAKENKFCTKFSANYSRFMSEELVTVREKF